MPFFGRAIYVSRAAGMTAAICRCAASNPAKSVAATGAGGAAAPVAASR